MAGGLFREALGVGVEGVGLVGWEREGAGVKEGREGLKGRLTCTLRKSRLCIVQ